jgi:CspA family cold shock protein
VVQRAEGFRAVIQPSDGSKDVFVHVSAVERAGLPGLAEGQKVSFDVVSERGKQAAGNLKLA